MRATPKPAGVPRAADLATAPDHAASSLAREASAFLTAKAAAAALRQQRRSLRRFLALPEAQRQAIASLPEPDRSQAIAALPREPRNGHRSNFRRILRNAVASATAPP